MAVDTGTRKAWGQRAWTDATPLREHYERVRAFTLDLCAPLETEDYVAQSMTDASPTKWHIAHTTWFFEQFVLSQFVEDYEPFHPDYSFLFNSYYNAVGKRTARPIRGLMTRPSVEGVRKYRAHVDRAIMTLLESGGDEATIRSLVEIGLQHEQQHQELIVTDVKHLLSLNPVHPAYHAAGLRGDAGNAPPLKWLRHEEGLRWIGYDGDAFAYDNEGPRHREFLETFEIGDRLVTNGEYLQFIADGGYERPELWLDAGWATATAEGWTAPLYWEQRDGAWHAFTMGGFIPLDPDEPVCHVSYFEAAAFAEWSEARLPTEAEWETAVEGVPLAGNLADEQRFHPRRVQPGDAAIKQAFGDTWEWTSSAYSAYPGYHPVPGALGEYNGKFMCNQFVLRGGSCATHSTHLRPTYRNFFHPAARWQFSGIRLARNA